MSDLPNASSTAASVNARTEAMIAGLETKYQRQSQALKAANGKIVQLEETIRVNVDLTKKHNEQLEKAERDKIDAENKLSLSSNQVKTLETMNESNNTNNLRLQRVVDKLNDQIADLNRDKMTLEVEIDSRKAKEKAREGEGMAQVFERERVNKEKEILENHSNYLQEELDRVRNEHLTFKTQTNTTLINSTGTMESLTLENKRLQERQKVMEGRVREVEDSLLKSEEKVRASDKSWREKVEELTLEGEGKDRLINLLESQTIELEARGAELEKVIDEIKIEVSDGVSKMKEVEMDAQNMLQAEKEKSSALQSEINVLKKNNASSLSNIVGFDPNDPSAPASAMTNIVERGLSVTDMYARVVELETELTRERSERKKCDLYMERILREIEAKAPIFAQQKMDYERAMESHRVLEEELKAARNIQFTAERNFDSVTKEWEREVNTNKILKEENRTFAMQIQQFLREKMSENEGGGDVMMITDGSNTNLFRNVEELQTNNALLLREKTSLSIELKSIKESDDRMSLQQTIESTERELKKLRQERSEQEAMVQSIVEQRDMYKRHFVLSQTEAMHSSVGDGIITSGGNNGSNNDINKTSNEDFVEVKSKLIVAEKSIANLDNKIKKMEENDKLLSDQLEER